MSLILDALNRSRQDSEQVPGLSSNHFVKSSDTSAGWGQWLLVCALALAVLVIGWVLVGSLTGTTPGRDAPGATPGSAPPGQLRESGSPADPAVEPVEERPRQATAGVPPPAAAPVATQARRPAADVSPRKPAPEPAAPPADPAVAALYRQKQQASAGEPAAVAPPEQQAAPALQAPAEERVHSSRTEETIDIEQLVQQAQAELADGGLSEHEVPLLSSLSQQTKDAVPTLMYLRHEYSGNPSKSSVHINGMTLRVGGTVGGVKVLEILPDSVVLEHRGSRFRLRALNSWVNL